MIGRPLLIQMSGAPGCGKSTLARAIAARIDAVVLDHDVIKSALLDAGLPAGRCDPVSDPEGLRDAGSGAGQAAYDVAFALAAEHLEQRASVVLDSPCYYGRLLRRGLLLASGAGAAYRYVECVTGDLDEIARRLRARERRLSQCADLAPTAGTAGEMSGEDLFRTWIAGMRRPADGYIRVDTSRPVQVCLTAVLGFLADHEEAG